MRLKILIVPFFIISILVLSVGYIKPDLDTLKEKKTQIAAKEAELAQSETLRNNIQALNAALDTQPETENFLYRYLPSALNQEQVIDTFNFLAVQAGLAITGMELIRSTETARAPEPILDPTASTLVAGGDTFQGQQGLPLAAPPVLLQTFTLRGSVAGSYENIKAFFERLTRIERFQSVRLFVIDAERRVPSASEGESAGDISGMLRGTFETSYGYLPSQPVASALGIPAFTRSTFDLNGVSRLVETLNTPIPTLEKSPTGKANPFE